MQHKQLTYNQNKWLQTASSEEIRAFISKGEVETALAVNSKTLEMACVPLIRGIRVAGSVEEAEAYLAELRDDTLPELDERSLNITGECLSMAESCEQLELRISNVLHLGSLAMTEGLDDHWDSTLLDFKEFLEEGRHKSEPSMAPFTEAISEYEFDEEVELMLDELIPSNNLLGFVLKVGTPVRSDHGTCGWHHYHSSFVYGETYEEAFSNAKVWAEKQIKGE